MSRHACPHRFEPNLMFERFDEARCGLGLLGSQDQFLGPVGCRYLGDCGDPALQGGQNLPRVAVSELPACDCDRFKRKVADSQVNVGATIGPGGDVGFDAETAQLADQLRVDHRFHRAGGRLLIDECKQCEA